jgi:hypothetical protein
MTLTTAMTEARDIDEMADAFHPTALEGTRVAEVVDLSVRDAIEAALLFGAKRISKHDFLSAVEALA